MRTINLRFLAFLLAGLALLSTGVYFLHAYQVRRNAGALLDQAHQAKEKGDLQRAARYFRRYLGFALWDTDALAEYGFILEKLATTGRAHRQAFLTLEEVLRREPDRDDVRRQQASLAMKLGLYTDAIAHYRTLHEHAPRDAELLDLLAQAEEGAGHYSDAAQDYNKALEAGQRTVETYLRLATLLRRQPNAVGGQAKPKKSAEAYVDEMIAQHKKSFRAYLALAGYHREFGPKDKVADDVAHAQALAPHEAEVLLALAEIAGTDQSGRDQARKHLQQGIKLYPKDARFYLSLAQLELRARVPAEADRWLREAAKYLPKTTDARWAVGDLFLDADDVPEARKVLDGLLKDDPASPLVRYLQARVYYHDGAWYQASEIFKEVRPRFVTSKDLSKRTSLFLGQCYEHLGNPDLALAAYREAVSADAAWVPAHLGLASAALSLNKTDAALEEYRALQDTVPESGLAIARLLILRNLSLASAARDWDQVENVLASAEKALPDSLDVRILRAEVLVAQDKAKEAQALLAATPQKQQQKAAYWVARAGLAERMNAADKVLPLLDEAERRLGPDLEIQLARARYWSKKDKAQAKPALAALERGLGKYKPADQTRFRLALAQAHYRVGDLNEAERLWTRVAKAEGQGNSLYVRLLLFDLALRQGKDDRMKELVAQIHDIEGPDGALWRYAEAARLVRQAEKGNKSSLDRAKQDLIEVGKLRPYWSRVALLQASIDDLEGDSEAAIKNYQEAVRQGDRQTQVLRRLVHLLYERRRYVEANEVLSRLPEETPISGDLVRLAAEISLRNQDPERAVQFADLAAKSRDYHDLIWAGQIHAALRHNAEAEKRFLEAIKLGGQEPDAWVAYVLFLARTDKAKQAEEVMAEAQTKLPAAERPLALAQCYEALGKQDKAAAQYQAALKANPNDGRVLRGAADYYLRLGLPQKAETHLRHLLTAEVKAAPEESAWARRNLAFVYALQGKTERLKQALALLDENRKLKGDRPEDQRTRAIVLALHPGRQKEAIRTLEELGRRYPLTPDEKLVLASLYEASGDWRGARSRLLSLVTANADNPKYLAHYIRSLLLHKEVDEAEHWLGRLEKLDPSGVRTLDLKTRLLAKQGRVEEAIAAVKAYAQGQNSQLSVAAALLDNLGKPAAKQAEDAYRRVLDKSNNPDAVLAYAGFLSRRGRINDALDLCERALPKDRPDVLALAGASLIRAGKAKADQVTRVEHWLTAALAKKATPALLLGLASVQDYREDYTAAVTTYRRVLDLDSDNVMALNNLAWLLSLKLNQHAEALADVNRAIDKAGPLPRLLDTRAILHLQQKQADSAVQDLETVVAQEPSAGRYFHLAQARLAAHNRAGAVSALANARAMGLGPDGLHPLELAAYRDILASLAQQ